MVNHPDAEAQLRDTLSPTRECPLASTGEKVLASMPGPVEPGGLWTACTGRGYASRAAGGDVGANRAGETTRTWATPRPPPEASTRGRGHPRSVR